MLPGSRGEGWQVKERDGICSFPCVRQRATTDEGSFYATGKNRFWMWAWHLLYSSRRGRMVLSSVGSGEYVVYRFCVFLWEWRAMFYIIGNVVSFSSKMRILTGTALLTGVYKNPLVIVDLYVGVSLRLCLKNLLFLLVVGFKMRLFLQYKCAIRTVVVDMFTKCCIILLILSTQWFCF